MTVGKWEGGGTPNIELPTSKVGFNGGEVGKLECMKVEVQRSMFNVGCSMFRTASVVSSMLNVRCTMSEAKYRS